MSVRLIVVEGLPGSGKSTTAREVARLLKTAQPEQNVLLYEEGRTDHPADYEGYAFFTQREWAELEARVPNWIAQLKTDEKRQAVIASGGRLLAYRKIEERTGEPLPEDVRHTIEGKDIYELPLDLHIELIVSSWQAFAEKEGNKDEDVVYVFECCLMQNPVTMGMIRCDADTKTVVDYVKRLEHSVRRLNPVVIYVDQADLGASFRKAVAERPREWSDGFMRYYLQQGYGAANMRLSTGSEDSECSEEQAVEATIEVLRARRLIEDNILAELNIPVFKLDNSGYDNLRRETRLNEIFACFSE